MMMFQSRNRKYNVNSSFLNIILRFEMGAELHGRVLVIKKRNHVHVKPHLSFFYETIS